MSTSTVPVKRVLVTLNVPEDTDPANLAHLFDFDLPSYYPGVDVDSTVYATEELYLADLEYAVCREGPCSRCGVHVEERFERVAIDMAGRNDCGESEDGAPHEIDELA